VFGVSFFAAPLFARSPQSNPVITLQVYNSALVAPDILAAAETDVTRIFRAAGITVFWFNCSLSESEAAANPICTAPCPPNRLAVRINSEMPEDLPETSLGVAFTDTGIYATIYYPRIEQYVKRGIANQWQILAHAISHEIGHLLLGPAAHARVGIMRGTWTSADLHSIAMGALLFSPWESKVMREAVIRGVRPGKNSGSSASPGTCLNDCLDGEH
jgi:hypothetical protein